MEIKSFFFFSASQFRKLIYRLYGRPIEGVLTHGVLCHVEDPTSDVTYGDVIHPCVRYIEEGFEGHQWWMVYTPLYGWNDKLENPRLCYSDAEEGEIPTVWKFYCNIKECPTTGYNSDPTMLFKDGKLYVFWRECHTPRTKDLGCYYAVVGCYVQGKIVTYLNNTQMEEQNLYIDKEVCPTMIDSNGTIKAYSLHQRYEPSIIHVFPMKVVKILLRFFDLLNVFRLYSRIKCLGIAIWAGEIEGSYQYVKTVKIQGVSRLYQPWHMDFFDTDLEEGKRSLFTVVQSNEKFADLCLAWSEDGEHFCLCDFPLFTSHMEGMKGLYKSTAQVVDGVFYMYYTRQDAENESLHRLFVTTIDWKDLKRKLGIRI